MRAFFAAVLVSAILAIAAGTALEIYVQQKSADSYARPSARV